MDLARIAPLALLGCAVAAVACLGTGLDVDPHHAPEPRPGAAVPPATTEGVVAPRPTELAAASRAAPAASPVELESPVVEGRAGEAVDVVVDGVVVDSDGRPIAGAVLRCGDRPTARSSRLGAFRFELPTTAELSIQADGFLPAVRRFFDVTRADVRIVLVRPGVLRGVVRGPDGPVAGARVSAVRTFFSGASSRFEVDSDPAGRFAFEALPAGVWEVGAGRAGERREARSRGVRIRAGVVAEVELDLHAVGPPPTVFACRAGAPGVAALHYELLVAGEPYQRGWPLTAPVDVDLEVRAFVGALQGSARATAGARQVEVPLERARRLTGRVLRATPAPEGADRDIDERWAKLDRLDLVFRPDDPRPGRLEAGTGTRLEPGVETFALEVPAERGGTLEVHSRHELLLRRRVEVGETDLVIPLPPVCALYWSGPTRDETHATADGVTFRRLSSLFEGGRAFVVAVRPTDGLAAAGWVELRPGESVRASLELAPAARVRGRVVDGAGHGLWTSLECVGQRHMTEPDGRFELLLPPGRFRVVAAPHPADVERWTGRPGARPTERSFDVTGDVDLGDLVVEVD